MNRLEQDGWRRLSPRMLLVHPVQEIGRFIPAVVAAAFFGSNSDTPGLWALAVLVFFVGWGVVRWLTTRYRFTPARVELQHGILTRSLITTPIDRVRSIDVTASALHRVLGLAKVRIGTGAGEKDLVLDGLSGAQAANLRRELLHDRGVSAAAGSTGGADGAGAPPSSRLLFAVRPAWVRYAPFNPANMVVVFALAGLLFRVAHEINFNPAANQQVHDMERLLRGVTPVVVVALASILVLVFAALLAAGAYILAFYGFTLTADDAGGSWHVRRGLITTRATSLDIARVRGVTIHQPVPLRWVGGARLSAITTGIRGRKEKEHGSRGEASLLAPPAPLPVVRQLADTVLGPGVLDAPIAGHGPVATRRRFTRALWPSAVLVVGLVTLAGPGPLPAAVAYAAPAVLVLAGLLAWDRARRLGHTLAGGYLVSRTGGLRGGTNVVLTDATVAVVVRQSVFQRRQGVATVELATAAGAESYQVLDVATDDAAGLAEHLISSGLAVH